MASSRFAGLLVSATEVNAKESQMSLNLAEFATRSPGNAADASVLAYCHERSKGAS